jgi:hypothetical protein
MLGASIPAWAGNLAQTFGQKLRSARPVVGCNLHSVVSDPGRCADIQELISLGRGLYASQEAEFVRMVSEELVRARRVQEPQAYSYSAILLAAISGDTKFEPALKIVMEYEVEQHFGYKYAEKAWERIRTGHCLNERPYSEVCSFHDAFFDRIHQLQGPI